MPIMGTVKILWSDNSVKKIFRYEQYQLFCKPCGLCCVSTIVLQIDLQLVIVQFVICDLTLEPKIGTKG